MTKNLRIGLTYDMVGNITNQYWSSEHFDPIMNIDPDGRYIEYGEKGKEKRELKRAIRFRIKTDEFFKEQYNDWKEDEGVAHKLRWQDAPQSKKEKRGTNSFENTFDKTNKNGDKVSHYFDKQKIEINYVADRVSLVNSNGDKEYHETLRNININEGQIRIKYNMYGKADELSVNDQDDNYITGTPGFVQNRGMVIGELIDVKNLNIYINRDNPQEDSHFRLRAFIIDYSKEGQKIYTHKRGALRKAKKYGFKTVG